MNFLFEVVMDVLFGLFRSDDRRVRDVERESWSVRRSRRRLEVDREVRRRQALEARTSLTGDPLSDD